jgi:hypothetical protein
LTEPQLERLREMFLRIREVTQRSVAWGDGILDNKERSYATVPRLSRWKSVEDISSQGILFMDLESSISKDPVVRAAAIKKHRMTKDKAFVSLDCSADEEQTLQAIVLETCAIMNSGDAAETLLPYEKESVSLENLVALQLNVHNKDDFMPLHVDDPRYDGFGIVLVTVALWGSAEIVLVDDGDQENTVHNIEVQNGEGRVGFSNLPPGKPSVGSKSWVFALNPGQLYVLSGHSRTKCAHGVVVIGTDSEGGKRMRKKDAEGMSTTKQRRDIVKMGRVSLTLRFGLHSAEQAHEDIDSHWG